MLNLEVNGQNGKRQSGNGNASVRARRGAGFCINVAARGAAYGVRPYGFGSWPFTRDAEIG